MPKSTVHQRSTPIEPFAQYRTQDVSRNHSLDLQQQLEQK